MHVPVEVKFHNMERSQAIEENVRAHVDKLERFHDNITRCRVSVEAPHHHHRQGNHYEVRIELSVPEKRLAVGHEPGDRRAHEDVYVTIRDAFSAMERQLERVVQKGRRQVKVHEEHPTGRVARIFDYEGYGFIETGDGREVYFDKNAVKQGNFGELDAGARVRFVESMGEKGAQASAVFVL